MFRFSKRTPPSTPNADQSAGPSRTSPNKLRRALPSSSCPGPSSPRPGLSSRAYSLAVADYHASTNKSPSPSPSKALIPRPSSGPPSRVPEFDYAAYQANASTYAGAPVPTTETERYWAQRALRAEAQLERLRAHSSSFLGAAAGTSWAVALAKIEKVVLILLLSLSSLTFFIVYRLTSSDPRRHPTANSIKHHLITFGFPVPTHFTIPILSPFTSVVEHEHAMIGSRTIALVVVVLGLLGYVALRHWLTSNARR